MLNLRAALHHHLARSAAILLFVTPGLFACATVAPEAQHSPEAVATPEQQLDRIDNNAVKAAVADGVSTGLALSAGAIEMNPLISTSPIGLIALTGAKIGLVKYAETLPEQQKRLVIKTSTAIWGGAAVNNLMVLMAAPTPLAVIAGVLVGVISWRHTSNAYEAVDRAIAAREQASPVDGERIAVASVATAEAR
jgi:hypothetical protein